MNTVIFPDRCEHGNTYYYPAKSCPVCQPNGLAVRMAAIEARLAEIERQNAFGIHTGVTFSTHGAPTPCPQCGASDTVFETGKILTSMPSLTEKGCKKCNHKWGVP